MPQVIEHLAELTGHRDRDVLDVTLVGALRDVLQPLCVAIYRSVGHAGAEHWLTRAKQCAQDTVATADPLWAELDSLPALADYPLRIECMRMAEARVVGADDGRQSVLSIFPLSTEAGPPPTPTSQNGSKRQYSSTPST